MERNSSANDLATQLRAAEKRCKELNDLINKSGPESAEKQREWIVKECKYW